MNFVDDDRLDGFENFAAFRGGEKNVKRFGRGDEDVGRALEHFAALVHQRVAGADGGANFRHQKTAIGGELKNFAERNFEIFLDVVAESFERRDVKDFEAIGEFAGERFANETVDTGEKCGKRLAGTGRRGDQRGFSCENVRPALFLGLGGSAEAADEPLANDGVGPFERRQCGGSWSARVHIRRLEAVAAVSEDWGRD